MSGSEGLGYGTQITIDGAYADAAILSDHRAVSTVLRRIVAEVEPFVSGAISADVVLHSAGEDGLSAALIRGETAALLHAFPPLRTVTLSLFSAHDLSLTTTIRTFQDAFGVRRFQSSVRTFGHYPPRDPALLERALAGLRDYARLRVAPSATVTT
jgi:hypothetical protein